MVFLAKFFIILMVVKKGKIVDQSETFSPSTNVVDAPADLITVRYLYNFILKNLCLLSEYSLTPTRADGRCIDLTL